MMKYIKSLFTVSFMMLAAQAAWAEEQSCEVIVVADVEGESQEALLAASKFLPADDFIQSVYDDEDGHMTTVDDLPIRAVMCRRDNIIPTLRDAPLLQTGLSLSLSQNFDSADSGLLTVYDDGKAFKSQYSGPPLTETQEAALADVLNIFDLQRAIK